MTQTSTHNVFAFSQALKGQVPSDLVEFNLSPYPTCAPENTVDISELDFTNVVHDREFSCIEADVHITFFLHWSLPPIHVTQHSIVGVSDRETADGRRAELVRTAIVLALMKLESVRQEVPVAA